MQLRYYQQDAIDAAFHWFDTQDTNPLIVLPTGSGKTVVFASMIKKIFEDNRDSRVLILAHRQELISQADEKLKTVWPCAPSGLLAAGLKQFDSHEPIVIASRDTLATPRRLMDAGQFDYIIVDEAHHVGPEKRSRYRKIFDHFDSTQYYAPKVLGVTATPYRMGQGFIYGLDDHFFGGVAHRVTIPELIKAGYLCRLSAYQVASEAVIDASTARVKFKGGDYRESDIEHLAMEDQTMLAIVGDWIDKAYSKGRLSSVFFCITVAHANKMCMYLRNAGVEAAVVTAETPSEERKKILEDFEHGVINALCNVAVLTEGWDAPRTDCIALLRPTKSLGLYVQICGRGMRTWGDKKDCMLLDYGENMQRHGCIDTARPEKPDEEESTEPKIWICDHCYAVNDMYARNCVECEEPRYSVEQMLQRQQDLLNQLEEERKQQEEKDAAATREAAQGNVLSDELEEPSNKFEKRKDVDFVRAEVKTSKNGNEYLNVKFSMPGEYWPQSMPIMLGMHGKAGMVATKKWRTLTRPGTPVTHSLTHAAGLVNEDKVMSHIKQITVRKEGKYWNVVSVHF